MRRRDHAAWAGLASALVLALLASCGGPTTVAVPRAPRPSAAGVAATPPATVPQPYPAAEPLGLAEDLQYLTGDALEARLDDYARLGVQWARFQLIWANVQPDGPADWRWGPIDALVDGLEARGISVLGAVTTTPAWADRAPGCAEQTCAPADPAQFASFAGAAAARYQGRVAAWEVWNEPNIALFWKPTPDPVAYAALLRAVRPAVAAGDPGAVVVSGGPAPAVDVVGPDGRPTSTDPVTFLQQTYAAGAAGSFDAVGWHPYSYPRAPGGLNPTSAWVQMYGTATNVRGIMTAFGDGAKPVWATEFGAHTAAAAGGALTEDQQAEYLGGGIDLWRGYPWAGPFFIYQLRDRGTDETDQEDHFGLERADGSPKPAWDAVARRVVR